MLKSIYFDLLGPVVTVSTTIGFFSGIGKYQSRKEYTAVTPFIDRLGNSSLGFMIGMTYPVSLPVLSGFVIFSESDKTKKG